MKVYRRKSKPHSRDIGKGVHRYRGPGCKNHTGIGICESCGRRHGRGGNREEVDPGYKKMMARVRSSNAKSEKARPGGMKD